MMDETDQKGASIKARERGNEAYKQGKLVEAEKAYNEAASLAPDDPAPVSNLSAVKFEQGQYKQAIELLEKALSLSVDEADDGEKKQKLLARLSRYCVLAEQWDGARSAMEMLADSPARVGLSQSLDAANAWGSPSPELRRLVLDRSSKFKLSITSEAEYFPMGHDNAESQLDDDVMAAASPKEELAMMYCGSGDARNIFTTLVDILMKRKDIGDGNNAFCSKLHLTLLDIKPAALARTLIFFAMFMNNGIMQVQKVPGSKDAPTVMAYLFCAHVLPPWVHEKLQIEIKNILKSLAGDKRFPLPFISIGEPTRSKVIRILQHWQQPLGDQYSTKVIRRAIGANYVKNRATERHSPDIPPSMADDRLIYDDLTVMLPSDGYIKDREPELGLLVKAYKKDRVAARKALDEYLDEHWVTNVTLFDPDWEVQRDHDFRMKPWLTAEDRVPPIEADLLRVALALTAQMSTEEGLIDTVSQFLSFVSMSLFMNMDSINVELIAGEMTQVMEKLHHGCLEERAAVEGEMNPATFPKTYNLIHLSNIPDYIGGHLTTFMSTRPLLKDGKTSKVMFNNLLNPPQFDDHENFQAEYLLMPNKQHIADHFGFKRQERKLDIQPQFRGMYSDFMVEDYFHWDTVSVTRPLPQTKRLSRAAFEKWMYGHYLKICLPYTRPKMHGAPVHAPLSLAAFIRLAAHAVEIGYPAHWVSGILSAACEGKLKTTARAPRQLTVKPASLAAAHSAREMCVQAWRADLTVQLSMWSRLLPFGVAAPAGALVKPDEIAEYAVTFPEFWDNYQHGGHFMLLFWDKAGGKPPMEMRSVLLDDEQGTGGDKEKLIRENYVHIILASRYETIARRATFWARKDLIEKMQKEDWEVYIWRTDSWTPLTEGMSVKNDVAFQRSWVDDIEMT